MGWWASAFAGVLSIMMMLGCVEYSNVGDANLPPEGDKTKLSIGGLAAGDVISVKYPGDPSLDLSQKIRGDGKISLPMVGDVVAGGKELTKFQSELTGLYKSHLQNPTVVVTLEETAASVYVGGRVKNPTKVMLDRPMTALEAIMEAGGFNDFGRPDRVLLVRNEKGVHKSYNLNLAEAISAGTAAFYLKPYDVIYAR